MNYSAAYKFILLGLVATAYTVIISIYVFSGTTLVPWAMNIPFADLITITGSVECVKAGFDPFVNTQFDPWLRTYNYPKLWITIFQFLHWDRSTTNLIGLILIYVFTLASCFMFEMKKVIHLAFVLLLVLSPPILLLLERGNCDVFIFILLAFALFYLQRMRFLGDTTRLHLTYLIILFTSMLKIYPIFLMSILLFEKVSRKNFFLIIGYSTVIWLAYLSYIYKDLLFIHRNTPRPDDLAYVKNILLQLYEHGKKLFWITNGLMALTAGLAYYFIHTYPSVFRKIIPISSSTIKNSYVFLGGALIYLGTFFIGNNWDYRLCFLLLLIPFVLDIFNFSKSNLIMYSVSCIFITLFYGTYLAQYIDLKSFALFKWAASWVLCFFISLVSFHLLVNLNEVKRSHTGL